MNTLTPTVKTTRNINLDLIRIIAFMFVPSVHFFLHNGFYSNVVDNPRMYIMVFMRNLFLLCIPLFMILTGYLQGNKDITPSKKYFFKLTKFIIPYLIIMTFDLIFILFVLKKDYAIKDIVQNYTSFTHYSWYVEMYIGLFLLIPFLNMMWRGLKNKKQHLCLVAILIILTIVPSMFNAYQFESLKWFSCENDTYWNLFPDWWKNFYPITYYFVGAYLCKYKSDFKLKPIFSFLIFLGSWIIFGTYTCLRCHNAFASVHSWVGYNSWGIFLMGVTLFIFLNSIDLSFTSNAISKIMGRLSDLTFGAYLASWMLDQVLYTRFINARIPVMEDRLWVYIPAMAVTITTAFVISFVADFIYKTGTKILVALIRKTQ